MQGRSVLALVLVAAAAAAAVVLAREVGIADQLTPERLREFVRGFGAAAPLVFMGLYALRGAVLVIPASVLSLAGGLAFGPLLGTVYTVVGATGGAVLSYLLARWLGRGFVERILKGSGSRLGALDEGASEHGFAVVFFARLIPLIPFDAISLGAGLSGVRVGPFALGTLLGIIPGSFAYNFLGDSVTDVSSPRFVLAVALMALVASAPLVWRWVTKRGTAMQEMQSDAGDAAMSARKAARSPGS